jgi:hypothetical protein
VQIESKGVAMKRVLLLLALVVLAIPAAGAGATRSHTVDLGNGLLDGHRVLGRTIAGVTAGLGRPDFRLGPQSRYRIGWGSPSNPSVEVIFARSGGVERAWSIAFDSGRVLDVKLGNLLARRSATLQAGVLAQYGDAFKLLRPYACKAQSACVGEFAPRTGSLHLTFGTHPATGTWLSIWQTLG